jgi:hypothetical protein
MLEHVREAVRQESHRFTVHAQMRMAERRILTTEVCEAILSQTAEVIEEYPTDKYGPSCLVYGVTRSGRVLHIQANPQGVIITTYDPDPAEWIDLKRRRSR